MAAEFSQGLMAGFQFVDNIVDRRERRRLQEERIGLARAADTRAQQAHDTRQNLISEQRDVDRSTRASNEVLARAERVGFENLEPHEVAELEDAAQFNPDIATRLQEFREGRRDVEAISNVAGARRGLGGVVDQATQPQATQLPSGQVSRGQFVTEGAEPGVGALPEGPRGEIVTAPKSMLADLLPGFDVESLPTAGADGVNVPSQLLEELQGIEDLPVVDQERLRRRAKARLGSLESEITVSSLQNTAAQGAVDKWTNFLDPQNQAGATLRTLAADDPVSAATQFRDDFETLKRRDPNTWSQAVTQMAPVVNQAMSVARQQVLTLPLTDDGGIEMTPEARETQRQFNDMISLQQNMHEDFNDRVESRIRGNSMPVGNQGLTDEIMQDFNGTPAPGLPPTNAQQRANTTIANRAVNGIADGGRQLSTRQVESLAWLAKRGYISPGGFENFLSTGTFTDPQDAEFFDHDPTKTLYRQNPNGTVELVYSPPRSVTNPFDWPDDQMSMVDDYFTGGMPSNAPSEVVEERRRSRNNFLVEINRNPEAMHLAGLDPDDLKTMPPEDLAFLMARWDGLQQTKDAYNSAWFGMTRLFRGDLSERGVDITNYDEFARKYLDVDQLPPPVDVPQPQVQAARMSLIASDNMEQQILGTTGSDADIAAAINAEVEARGPTQ